MEAQFCNEQVPKPLQLINQEVDGREFIYVVAHMRGFRSNYQREVIDEVEKPPTTPHQRHCPPSAAHPSYTPPHHAPPPELTTLYCKWLMASTKSQLHLRKVFSSTAASVVPLARVHITDSAQYNFRNISPHSKCTILTPAGIDTEGYIISHSRAQFAVPVSNIARNRVKSLVNKYRRAGVQ